MSNKERPRMSMMNKERPRMSMCQERPRMSMGGFLCLQTFIFSGFYDKLIMMCQKKVIWKINK